MDEAHKQTDKELAKIERKLKKLYERAAREAQAKAKRFWADFQRRDEMKRKLVEEGKITKEEYIQWRKNKIGMYNGYYAPLADELATDMANTNRIAASIVNGHMPEVYANNYNYGTYQIEHDTLLDTSFTMYDKFTVERIMRDYPDLIPIQPKPDIPKDKLWSKRKINEEITQGILQGDSIPDIAKRMQRVVGMNHRAAVRTARTATTAAENGGRVDSYKRAKSMGIDLQQRWLATLDGRTRLSHRELDGETIQIPEGKKSKIKFSNGCRYPGDPEAPGEEIYNCRCTLIAVVEGVDPKRVDDMTLRNNSKLGGMSYEDWKAGHNPDGTEKKKGKKKGSNKGKRKPRFDNPAY